MSDYITRTLVAFATNNDGLWWRKNEQGELALFAQCSDTFAWGSADVEPITEESVDVLERCAAQLIVAQGSTRSLDDYYSARVRALRPQGAAYTVRYDPLIWPLFNNCGPQREIGMGNPSAVPNYPAGQEIDLRQLLSVQAKPIEVEVDVVLRDELLDIFGFDYTDDLRWKVIEDKLTFFVEGSHLEGQLFELNRADVTGLRQAKVDMAAAGQDYFFTDLFLVRLGATPDLSKHSFTEAPLALIREALKERA